jgi:16S rRNA G966 N2-methylase RsmD
MIKLSTIRPNPANPRTIKDAAFEKLCKSIQTDPEFMELRPIITDADNMVLGGNQRLKALKHLGYTEVPEAWIRAAETLSDDQKRRFIVLDNNSSGEWSLEELAANWSKEELEEWGVEVEWPAEPLEAKEDGYEIPETIQTDIVIGDLFEIGAHRLLCGDSTDSDQVARLMGGEKADMVFTDPPYGISHSGKGIKGAAKENDFGEILGDDDVNIAVNAFNLCASLYPEATLIFWGANYYSSALPNGYGWLVWDKEKEGDTFSGAELAFVNKGVRLDVFRHRWHGMIKASEMGEKRLHPTQKPIALAEFCFNNYQAGKIILDLFLGSGSTMVAAHQLNRKCYGMELDPKYCQVIIDRMRKLDPNIEIKKNGTSLPK